MQTATESTGQTARWEQAVAVAQEEIERCGDADVSVVSIFDSAYPDRLRMIDDPPPVLFVRGNLELLSQPRTYGLTGTLLPSEAGLAVTEGVAGALGSAGWTLVGGLLTGIVGRAHRSAMAQGAPTIAVVGGGLGAALSKRRERLAEKILEEGGALVSMHSLEHPVGRDGALDSLHVTTGLAAALVVIDSLLNFAPMRVVRCAAEQKRPIFCAKPPPRAEGDDRKGLEVLLESPSAELIQEVPRWKATRALVAALGETPLAQPVPEDPQELVAAFEHLVEAQPA